MKLIVLFLSAFLLAAGPGQAELRVIVSDQVAVADVNRFGMNISDTWWDAGAINRVRACYNFEGTSYRSIFSGPVQDENGIYIWQGLSGIPDEEFFINGRYIGAAFTILNGPARGTTGTVQSISRRELDYNGRTRELDYIEFDRAVAPGDPHNAAVLVERNLPDQGSLNLVGAGAGSHWDSPDVEMVQGDTAPGSFGQTALKMDGSGGRSYIRLPGVFVDVAEYEGDWSLSFRARALSGRPEVALAEPAEDAVDLTDEWDDYRFDFTVDGDRSSNLAAKLDVTGGAALIDDIVLRYEEGDNPTVFNDLFVKELKRLQPGIVRYLSMGGCSVENFLRPRLEQTAYISGPWMKGGPRGAPFRQPFSLHEMYELCQFVGADPWYCIPGTIHPEEVEQFLEYLAAPADTGMGRLRARQGQIEPWTEVFDEIFIEFGNEAWNSFGPFAAGGYNGPEYWQGLIERGKSSEWYRDNMTFMTAGQNFNGWLNRAIMENAPNADQFAIATYMIHKLDPAIEERFSGDDEALFRWLFGFTQRRLLDNDGMDMNADAARKHDIELAVYETNHHASDGDASSEFRNRFLASLGGGLNTLQNMLIMLQEYGARDQCFFTLFGEENTAYKVKDVRLFGAVLRLQNRDVRVRPHFDALVLANEALSGDLLNVRYEGDLPEFDADFYDESKGEWLGAKSWSALRVLPFAAGEKRSMILLNLDVSRPLEITLDLDAPVRDGQAVWKRLAADDLTANNELEQAEPQVVIQEGGLDEFRDGSSLTLPPHSLTVLHWRAQ